LVGPGEQHAAPAADRDVPERCGQVGFADSDRAEDQRPAGIIEEP
jgi:hypothetical protein